MKIMKKITAVLLSALFLFPVLSVVHAADTQSQTDALRFGDDGKFKIMIFTDAHDDDDLSEVTQTLMSEALDKYEPDFVVFLGDNITVGGYDRQVAAVDALTKPTRDRGIKFGMVLGNHDSEYGTDRDALCAIWDSFGAMTYDAEPALYGCGNCNLPIYSSDGEKIAFNLWFIDSGSTNPDLDYNSYDYVHPDQIEWYKRTALELKEQNGGEVVPAINFQHIIIPEIYDKLYAEVPAAMGGLTVSRGERNYFTVPNLLKLNGYWLEHPCPPDVEDGQLDAWRETGDVIAAFNGHDHKNTLQVNIKGVDVVNVPACGEAAYHSDYTQGVGLITLNEKCPGNYKYELIQKYKLALEKDSKIPEVSGEKRSYYLKIALLDAVPQIYFGITRFFNGIGAKIEKAFRR